MGEDGAQCTHSIDEKTEAQRDQVNCPKSRDNQEQSQDVNQACLKPKPLPSPLCSAALCQETRDADVLPHS